MEWCATQSGAIRSQYLRIPIWMGIYREIRVFAAVICADHSRNVLER